MTDRTCAHPDCDVLLTKKPGPGRYPRWCEAHHYVKKRTPGSQVKDWTARECAGCGEVIPARANNRMTRYCSRSCYRTAYEDRVRSDPERVAMRADRARERRSQRTPPPKKDLVCEACGVGFQTYQNARFCSKACSRHANLLDGKWCSQSGCSAPVQARGLCITHYNNLVSTTRRKLVDIPCAHCGTVVQREKRSDRKNQFCSFKCRDDFKFGKDRKALVWVCPVFYCEIPTSHPARRWSSRWTRGPFVSGPCSWCGEQFVAVDKSMQARFCSDRCKNRSARSSSRFKVAPRVRQSIYTRDNWICQLCFDPVDRELHPSDPWAATLDHIECQSWALVPDHSPSNLRLAHRWCNSVRGDETYYSAADLAAVA